MVSAGRWQWCSALALLCAAVLSAQTPPTSPGTKPSAVDEACTVSGMVVAKVDGTPLKGATVQLQSRGDGDHNILKEYEDKGQEIEVRDGDQKSLELKSLSAKDSQAKTE